MKELIAKIRAFLSRSAKIIEEKKSVIAILLLMLALAIIVNNVHQTLENRTFQFVQSVETIEGNVGNINSMLCRENGVIKSVKEISNEMPPFIDVLKDQNRNISEQNVNLNKFKDEVKNLCEITQKSLQKQDAIEAQLKTIKTPAPVAKPSKEDLKRQAAVEKATVYPVWEITPATTKDVNETKLKTDLLALLKKYNVTSAYVLERMPVAKKESFSFEYDNIIAKLNEGKYDRCHWYYLWMF